MPWYIIYTKSKHEKKVVNLYNEKGIETFLPTIIERKKWSDRIKKVEKVLFNSYVFVFLEEFSYEKIFVYGVVTYLKDKEKRTPKILPEKNIKLIKDWISNNQKVDIEVQTFKKGDSIEIDSLFIKAKNAIVDKVNKNVLIVFLEDTGIRLTIPKSQIIKAE